MFCWYGDILYFFSVRTTEISDNSILSFHENFFTRKGEFLLCLVDGIKLRPDFFGVIFRDFLCAAHRAVRIGITLCTEGSTGALLLCAAVRLLTCITSVLRVADFTNKGARLSLAALGAAALAI